MSGHVAIRLRRSDYAGQSGPEQRQVPVEAPIAIEINGIVYAVMMATPEDLADFVTGFLLSEGLADAAEVGPVAVHCLESGEGYVARVNLPEHRLAPITDRARRRLGDSSCGLCGMESIEEVLRPLPPLEVQITIEPQAIRRALAAMASAQVLGAATAATHAAGFFAADGTLMALREDVGRHNALDKLIGALAVTGGDASQGFIAVTSRCSYELVEKAVRARCSLLVAISAPTDLAVRRAQAAGLSLAVVARDDSMLWIGAEAAELENGL